MVGYNLPMNMNVYKNNSSNQPTNIKDSISFSKINAKIKKRQMNPNLTGLQTSCNTNPNRGANAEKDKDRDGSQDATSNFNMRKNRDNSAGKENSYLTAQVYNSGGER